MCWQLVSPRNAAHESEGAGNRYRRRLITQAYQILRQTGQKESMISTRGDNGALTTLSSLEDTEIAVNRSCGPVPVLYTRQDGRLGAVC